MSYGALSKYRSELMGMAMLWILLYHAWDLRTGIPPLDLLRTLGFGGVDIFILLSSLGLVCALARREQTYTEFMARRAGRILPAYFAVMVPSTLLGIFRGTALPSALVWDSLLLYYWISPADTFNWYITGIMTFYALTPFFFRRMRAHRGRVRYTGIAVVLSLLLCQVLMRDGWWRYLDIFYRFPLFFLGLLMGFFVLEERPLKGRDILFWTAVFVAGVAYRSIILAHPYSYAPMVHMFLFTSVPVCLAGCVLFEKLPLGWLRKVLRLVGENSLEIYLLNVCVVYNLEFLHSLFSFGPSNRLFWLIIFTANILLGILLHRLIEYLRRMVTDRCRAREQKA